MKTQQNTFKHAIASWIPLAIAIISLGSLMFISFQQYIRTSANNPLQETAENLIGVIESGVNYDQLKSNSPVDIKKENSFIYVVVDDNKSVVASNIKEMEKYSIPTGVYDQAKKNHSKGHVVTWRPEKDIYLAIYVKHFSGERSGYVITARTLYSINQDILRVGIITGGGTAVTLSVSLLAVLISSNLSKQSENSDDEKSKPSSKSKKELTKESGSKGESKPEVTSEPSVAKSKSDVEQKEESKVKSEAKENQKPKKSKESKTTKPKSK